MNDLEGEFIMDMLKMRLRETGGLKTKMLHRFQLDIAGILL